MSFMFPLGLLGLIAVPILIIIYILRNRYKEHIVSSSYLFELSNRFLKKKRKLNKYEGLISLIVEIMAVTILSLSLAHPVFYKKDNAENICFIIDGSGSMNILNENTTRFELAKSKMNDMVKQAKQGSTYTLIYAGAETKTVVKRTDSKDVFYQFSGQLNPEYAFVELDDALEKANEYYQIGEISKLIVLTDKNYEFVENIELINVSSHEINYATYDLTAKETKENLEFKGKLFSYESDALLTINMYLDDELIDTQEVEVFQGIESDYQFKTNKQEYNKVIVEIANDDALDLDNRCIYYNITEENQSSVILVSESPFYLNSIISAVGKYSLTVVDPKKYNPDDNYDLYIFDCFTPDSLPSSGAVWFLNSDQNVEYSGFLVQDDKVSTPESFISYNYEKNGLYEQIVEGVKYDPIMVYKYKKYSLYQNFITIFNCDSIPLLFVGMTETNIREVVFAFDLHDTDLPLLYDFAPIMRNLLNYSLPRHIEDKNYVAGDSLQINIFNDFDSVKITTPSNKSSFVSLNSNIEYYLLTEVGTYEITITSKGEEKKYNVYVSFDKKEGHITVNNDFIGLEINENIKKNTSIFDKLFIVILLGTAFFVLDWVMYAHEQY